MGCRSSHGRTHPHLSADPPSLEHSSAHFQEVLENFFESDATPLAETVKRGEANSNAGTMQKLRHAAAATQHNVAGSEVDHAIARASEKPIDGKEPADVSMRWRSEYISNLRGYFSPPITSEYTLVATSEDNAGVWVTSGDERNKVLEVHQWVLFPRDFSKSLMGSPDSSRIRPTLQTFRDNKRKSDKIQMRTDEVYLVKLLLFVTLDLISPLGHHLPRRFQGVIPL